MIIFGPPDQASLPVRLFKHAAGGVGHTLPYLCTVCGTAALPATAVLRTTQVMRASWKTAPASQQRIFADTTRHHGFFQANQTLLLNLPHTLSGEAHLVRQLI